MTATPRGRPAPPEAPIDAAEAERRLAAREAGIPGLALVLDGGALLDRLSPRLPIGADRPRDARVAYLRYKPGTSLTAAYVLDTPRGERHAYAQAWAGRRHAPRQLAREDRWCPGPDGWAVLLDRDVGIALATVANDPKLPALRRRGLTDLVNHADTEGDVAGDGRTPADCVHTLRYNPGRRWVARLPGPRRSVIRVQRPRTIGRAAAALGALHEAGLPVPGVLRSSPPDGVLVTTWLDGAALPPPREAPKLWRHAGALLAEVHRVHRRPGTGPEDVAREVVRAAASLGHVLPELARPACAVARRLAEEADSLRRCAPVLVHGDFSADQLLTTPQGLALLDLDRARIDDPCVDAASFLADALVTDALSGGDDADATFRLLLDGYVDQRGARPPADHVRVFTAAALLRRAVEPFRRRRDDWPSTCAAILQTADVVLHGGCPPP